MRKAPDASEIADWRNPVARFAGRDRGAGDGRPAFLQDAPRDRALAPGRARRTRPLPDDRRERAPPPTRGARNRPVTDHESSSFTASRSRCSAGCRDRRARSPPSRVSPSTRLAQIGRRRRRQGPGLRLGSVVARDGDDRDVEARPRPAGPGPRKPSTFGMCRSSTMQSGAASATLQKLARPTRTLLGLEPESSGSDARRGRGAPGLVVIDHRDEALATASGFTPRR